MVAPTPKFKSGDFKRVLGELKEIFDGHSLGVVLLDALERKSADQIYKKVSRQSGGARAGNKKKAELVARLTAAFFAVDEVSYQIIKELDRSCQKERHIVASIPEAQAPTRIGSYRAIALKRERAKFVWALARDDRESVRQLANRIIEDFFEQAAEIETTRSVLSGDENEERLKDIALAKRLQEQAERLAEAAEKVNDLEDQVSSFEDERAKLLAQMGSKERTLRRQTEARSELEAQIEKLRVQLADVEQEERLDKATRSGEIEAKNVIQELQQKVRRLSKLAGASQSLSDAQTQVVEAKRANEALTKSLANQIAVANRERGVHRAEVDKLRGELESMRGDLRQARRALAESSRASVVEGDAQLARTVAVLLDQANLAASAADAFKAKVDFSRLHDRLAAGRTVKHAIAFVVDNGGHAFDAFCEILRKSGWDLRIKRPKTFRDGSTKADWDMGMAMEAVDLRDRVETFVLVTGDGDFSALVRRLKGWGHRVEVAAFPQSLASELANVADAVTTLDAQILE